MSRQGRELSQQEVARIQQLLATDMTVAEIAKRMQCSTAYVRSVNYKFKVRAYHGKRATFTIEPKHA